MRRLLLPLALVLLAAGPALGGAAGQLAPHPEVAELLPPASHLLRVLTLQDYNTRVVVIGTLLLGLAGGVIGVFMMLRKRALVGDAVSHAALPGIGMAFIVMTQLGGDGKFLPGLLLGALVSSLLGIATVLLIRNLTRLKEDAALGIVLSVYFGMGVALLGVIQKMRQGNAAGLESFIYGKTASMLSSDAWLIAAAAGAVALLCVLLFKEFTLVCFDQEFAGAQGWPVLFLDLAMMGLVIAVTVIGLQAVGLILVVALLIIPAAAARFWTDHLPGMVAISALIGGLGGMAGAAVSALAPRLPAGALIVVVCGLFFVASLLFGTARGLVVRLAEEVRTRRRVGRQHLLRAMHEAGERWGFERGIPADRLLASGSWSPVRLRGLLAAARREGLVEGEDGGAVRLTPAGRKSSERLVRNHRLWEIYLIEHADIAPSHVDRDADEIEHVLGREMTAELEGLLASKYRPHAVPPSPHLTSASASNGERRAP